MHNSPQHTRSSFTSATPIGFPLLNAFWTPRGPCRSYPPAACCIPPSLSAHVHFTIGLRNWIRRGTAATAKRPGPASQHSGSTPRAENRSGACGQPGMASAASRRNSDEVIWRERLGGRSCSSGQGWRSGWSTRIGRDGTHRAGVAAGTNGAAGSAGTDGVVGAGGEAGMAGAGRAALALRLTCMLRVVALRVRAATCNPWIVFGAETGFWTR